MGLSPGRRDRAVRRASDLCFDAVQDPRRRKKRQYSLAGLLGLITAGLASQKLLLRDLEAFGSDLSLDMLRRLGLKRAPSDTTFWEVIADLKPTGFREALYAQIRDDLDAKAITNDLFRGGVLTLDGKTTGSGMGEAPTDAVRQSVCDSEGTKCWNAYALRGCLSSSSARPVLDQEFIKTKGHESPSFRVVVARLVKQFPKLFRYLTVDAGMTSAENAHSVREWGKHYLFALKMNFKRLFKAAQTLTAGLEPVAVTTERAGGCLVRRELRRARVGAECNYRDGTEYWNVRQVKTDADGRVTVENRFYITSIPVDELSDAECLGLVRLHWGIENGPNWTADVIFKEDDHTPCAAGNGVLIMAWLRSLAYNLLSVFRAHLPQKDRRLERWRRAAELLRDALVFGAVEVSEFPVLPV